MQISIHRQLNDRPPYALSSLIAHQHLYNGTLDGIEYPDAATEESFNYALRPAAADKLILSAVWRVHAKSNMTFHPHEVADVTDNGLRWREPSLSDSFLPDHLAENGTETSLFLPVSSDLKHH